MSRLTYKHIRTMETQAEDLAKAQARIAELEAALAKSIECPVCYGNGQEYYQGIGQAIGHIQECRKCRGTGRARPAP